MILRRGKGSTSFSEEKEAKRLFLLWVWGARSPAPSAQCHRVFLRRLFSKK
jgi:hypothetical protein